MCLWEQNLKEPFLLQGTLCKKCFTCESQSLFVELLTQILIPFPFRFFKYVTPFCKTHDALVANSKLQYPSVLLNKANEIATVSTHWVPLGRKRRTYHAFWLWKHPRNEKVRNGGPQFFGCGIVDRHKFLQ